VARGATGNPRSRRRAKLAIVQMVGSVAWPVGMVLSLLKPEADALVASGGATYDPGPGPSDRVGAEQRPVRIETR
jgi:hypothetical protein